MKERMEKTPEALREHLIGLHRSELERYTLLWENEEARAEEETTKGEAACGLLEHFGMLYRYTGNERQLQALLDMPEDWRIEVADAAACRLAEGDAPEATAALWAMEEHGEGGQARVESAFFLRDEIAVTLAMIKSLLWDVFEAKKAPETFENYARALQMERRLDQVMRSRPELALFAPGMGALGACAVAGMDPNRQWWFALDPQAHIAGRDSATAAWLDELLEHHRDRLRITEKVAHWFVPRDEGRSASNTENSNRTVLLGAARDLPALWAVVEGREEAFQLELHPSGNLVLATLHAPGGEGAADQYRLRLTRDGGGDEVFATDAYGQVRMPATFFLEPAWLTLERADGEVLGMVVEKGCDGEG